MRKLLLATTAVALSAGAVSAEDIKIGVILGFTGPIESLTPKKGSDSCYISCIQQLRSKRVCGELPPQYGRRDDCAPRSRYGVVS